MKKRYLLALLSCLMIFLLIGCTQNPAGTNDKETVKQEDTNKPTDSSSQKNEDEIPQSDTNDKNSAGENSIKLSELKVHYIDVGLADATLLQFSHEGEDFTILIDAGKWNRNDVVNYLNSQGISQIDIAIGTHPDSDHIGQLDKVLNTFEVGEVWMSGNTSNSQTFQKLLKAIDSSGADYSEPRTGDEFEIGPLEIVVLSPKSVSEMIMRNPLLYRDLPV